MTAESPAPTFPHGCRVRAHVRAEKYNGHAGYVVGHNLGEVGVKFTDKPPNENRRADAWFLPRELERL